MLSDLIKPKSVIIVSTDSPKAYMYVYDRLKLLAKSNTEGVLHVKDKKTFALMLERLNFEPLTSLKWVFEIEYSSVRSDFEKNKKVFERCETAHFLVRCGKYADFLKAKTGVVCTSLYISRLWSVDVNFLLGNYLSPNLQGFLASNYGAEKCFDLLEYFQGGGAKLPDKKSLMGVLGSCESSTVYFVSLLLRDFKGSKRSLRMQVKSKMEVMNSLLEEYNVRSLRNFLINDVKMFIQIKQLYLEGILYDSIRKDRLPESYDFNKLSRYSRNFDEIVSIPMERLLFLLNQLAGGIWLSGEDAFSFVYNYYLSLCRCCD